MTKYNFYSLLYIDNENKHLASNGVYGDFDEQMMVFIKCCEALQKSLAFFSGCRLIILTNDSAYVKQRSADLTCIEIPFSLEVPNAVEFFSSHYKIDAYKWFYTNCFDEYSFLIDSDVLCINKMPENLQRCIDNNIPVFYDITDQVYPAYGREIIIADKNKLLNNNSSMGLWAGGEFIGGPGSFYKQILDEIPAIFKIYLDNYLNLHHQGDEAIVSAAIENLQRKGVYIADAGTFGAIGRYWSCKTLHIQNLWESQKSNFLIHLPSDKASFLAKLRTIDDNVINEYEKHLKRRGIVAKPVVYYDNSRYSWNRIKRKLKRILKVEN